MNGIGRLPTQASSAVEDNELELLELQLRETVDVDEERCRRRRLRRRRTTQPHTRLAQRSLMTLWSDRGLLDEAQTEQTRRMLGNVTSWDFNAFSLDRLTNGRSLPMLCTHLLHEQGLLRRLSLDALTTWRFFYLAEQGYHRDNPYHNAVHACDVTQAIHCFLREDAVQRHLTPLEYLAALIASVCHDLDHPGRNEKFLQVTSSHLAGMYYGASVLENHHWRSALSVLWESGLASQLEAGPRERLMVIVRDMVLATDISRQQEFLEQLRQHLDNEEEPMDLAREDHRLFALQMAMKCADISNPCRSWNISRIWSLRACEEFYRQGDQEMQLGMTVTPFCDRSHMSVAKVQAGFYRFVASPLFEEWNRFLTSPLSAVMLHNMTSNQARWDLIVQQEARNLMVESVTSSTTTTSSSSSSSSGSQPPGSRRESMDPPQHPPHFSHQSRQQPPQQQRRRHHRSAEGGDDDDDSDPCASFPYLPLGCVATSSDLGQLLIQQQQQSNPYERRHSLPVSSGSRSHLSESRTSSEESGGAGEDPCGGGGAAGHLHRQSSLVERRRMVRQSGEGGGLYPGYRRRRIFAATSRSPMQTCTAESESRESSFENDTDGSHRVTFHLGPREEEEEDEEEERRGGFAADEDKENSSTLQQQRRGSAPGDLLVSQLCTFSVRETPPAASSSTSSFRSAAAALSRTNANFCEHRRGSLPADLVHIDEFQEVQGQLRRFQCLPLEGIGSGSSSHSDLQQLLQSMTGGKKRRVQQHKRRSAASAAADKVVEASSRRVRCQRSSSSRSSRSPAVIVTSAATTVVTIHQQKQNRLDMLRDLSARRSSTSRFSSSSFDNSLLLPTHHSAVTLSAAAAAVAVATTTSSSSSSARRGSLPTDVLLMSVESFVK